MSTPGLGLDAYRPHRMPQAEWREPEEWRRALNERLLQNEGYQSYHRAWLSFTSTLATSHLSPRIHGNYPDQTIRMQYDLHGIGGIQAIAPKGHMREQDEVYSIFDRQIELPSEASYHELAMTLLANTERYVLSSQQQGISVELARVPQVMTPEGFAEEWDGHSPVEDNVRKIGRQVLSSSASMTFKQQALTLNEWEALVVQDTDRQLTSRARMAQTAFGAVW